MSSKQNPYNEFEETEAWKTIACAINDLVENGDILEQTDRRYIVGYICKLLLSKSVQWDEKETAKQKPSEDFK